MSPGHEGEVAFLETLRTSFERRGYAFKIHPAERDLPDFLGDYRPDAVATKDGDNIAIEVKQRASTADSQIRKIRDLFEGHSDWKLTIAYMGSDSISIERLPVLDRARIFEGLAAAQELAKRGYLDAAFVSGWSLLEAALNALRPQADKRPRTPGTTVQTLAMDGLISHEAEKNLRQLIQLRNRLVHGDLSAKAEVSDVNVVLDAVRSALDTSMQ